MQAVLEYTEQALQATMHEEVEKKPKARQFHSAASVFQPQIERRLDENLPVGRFRNIREKNESREQLRLSSLSLRA